VLRQPLEKGIATIAHIAMGVCYQPTIPGRGHAPSPLRTGLNTQRSFTCIRFKLLIRRPYLLQAATHSAMPMKGDIAALRSRWDSRRC
jgi:hypothetical protein